MSQNIEAASGQHTADRSGRDPRPLDAWPGLLRHHLPSWPAALRKETQEVVSNAGPGEQRRQEGSTQGGVEAREGCTCQRAGEVRAGPGLGRHLGVDGERGGGSTWPSS